MTDKSLVLLPVTGIPLLRRTGELEPLLTAALAESLLPHDGDVLVVAQKVVSKSEDRYRLLSDIKPGVRAVGLALRCGKPAAYVQAVLDESVEVIRCVSGVLITRHRLGHVMANAGIDQSNVDADDGAERVLLLPEYPDASARRLREAVRERFGADVAVLISDSFGRPWRVGTCGTCIGAAGMSTVYDLRGTPDLFGRPLLVSQQAVADELCSAAALLMGQASEGVPAVIARGFCLRREGRGARDLIRPVEEDLFR